MSDIWTGTGVWQGWRLTIDHVASSSNQPVLVDPSGKAYGPDDILHVEDRVYPADLAREIGVSRGAINGRRTRGTLPPYDGVDLAGRSYWYTRTLKGVLGK